MLNLSHITARLINEELENVPEKFHKPFNSMHEAYGIITEEYKELEKEIFFGEKICIREIEEMDKNGMDGGDPYDLHRRRIKGEAIQLAAMCARLIQEL